MLLPAAQTNRLKSKYVLSVINAHVNQSRKEIDLDDRLKDPKCHVIHVTFDKQIYAKQFIIIAAIYRAQVSSKKLICTM